MNRTGIAAGLFSRKNLRARQQSKLYRAAVESLERRCLLDAPYIDSYTAWGPEIGEGYDLAPGYEYATVGINVTFGGTAPVETVIVTWPDGSSPQVFNNIVNNTLETTYFIEEIDPNSPNIPGVGFEIIDSNQEIGYDNRDLPIFNGPPTGTMTSPIINEGSTATISIIDPIDPSPVDTATGFHYAFNPYLGSLPSTYAAASPQNYATYYFDDNTTQWINGRIFDADDGMTDYSAMITVVNVAPYAILDFSEPDANGDITVTLNNISDPSSVDSNAPHGIRYAFAANYNNLPTNHSGATALTSTPPSHVFTAAELANGPVWAATYDKNGMRPIALNHTNLSTDVATNHQINLTWTDNVTGETGWRVQRSTDGTNFDWYTNLQPNTSSWPAAGLEDGKRYWFRARAYDESGNGKDTIYSAKQAETTPIYAPTFNPSPELHSDSVILEWIPNSVYETGFRLYKKVGNGGYDSGTTLGPGTTWHEVTGLSPMEDYTFKIVALGEDIDSDDPSLGATPSTIQVTTRPPAASLNVPTLNPDGTFTTISGILPPGLYPEQVDPVLWASVDGGAFVELDVEEWWNGQTFSFEPEAFPEGSEVTYKMTLDAEGNISDPSEEFTIVVPPAAPGLSSVPNAGKDSIVFAWGDPSQKEEGFELLIEPADGSEPWTITLPPNTTGHTLTGLEEAMEYSVTLTSFANGVSSVGASPYVVRTKLGAPDIVANESGAPNPFEMNLRWLDQSDVEDGYLITYSVDSTKYSVVAPANATGLPIVGLAPSTTYIVSIVAFVEQTFNGGPITVLSDTDQISIATPADTSDAPRPVADKAPPPPTTDTDTIYRFSFGGSPQVSNTVFTNTGVLVYHGPTWAHGTPPDITAGFMNSTISGTIKSENLSVAPTAYFSYPGPAFTDIVHSASHGEIQLEDTYGRNMTANAHDGEWHLWRDTITLPANYPSTDPPPQQTGQDAPLPYVWIEALDGNGAEENQDVMTFRVSRWQYDLTASLTVQLHPAAGTATSGDYSGMPSSVTIQQNQSSVEFSVTPVDDSSFEGTETVFAILKASNLYWLTTAFMGEGAIADNDISVDLDIDSNNDHRITDADDPVESVSTNAGKLLIVNRDDDDADKILDFADGFSRFDGTSDDTIAAAEDDFVRVVLRLSPGIDNGSTITFDYDSAGPSSSTVTRTAINKAGLDGETYTTYEYSVGDGLLRLWTKAGDMARTEGDFIEPEHAYTLSELGLSAGGEITLYLEAVNGSATATEITVTVEQPDESTITDTIKVFPLDPLIGIEETQIAGFNIVVGNGSSIDGTSGRDILIGTEYAEEIYGGGGDDIILPGLGDDSIDGETGRDTIFSWKGNKRIVMGFGDKLSHMEGNRRMEEGPEHVDQPFSSEDIIAAYKWMYGADDIWFEGFEELGGQVLAVAADGHWFSDHSFDYRYTEGLGFMGVVVGYDVKIEHDIGGGDDKNNVIVAAAALRQEIMSIAQGDSFRWSRFFLKKASEQTLIHRIADKSVNYDALEEWTAFRGRNFEHAAEVASIAADLYVNGMTLAYGAAGDVADIVINLPTAFQGDIGSMVAMTPLISGAMVRTSTRARLLVKYIGNDLFSQIGAKSDVYLREGATLGFVCRWDFVKVTGERVRPKLKIVSGANGKKVWIFGDAQKIYNNAGEMTQHSLPHATAIQNKADALAATGEYSHITLNREWGTAIGRGITEADPDSAGLANISTFQPDIIAVRWDGKVEAFEVLSPASQTESELLQKMAAGMNSLPSQYRTNVMEVLHVP